MCDIYSVAMNEAVELVRLAEAAYAEAKDRSVSKVLAFHNACVAVGFERGWDFGPVQGERLDRDFDLLQQAIIFAGAVRRAHGLLDCGGLLQGLETGRDARVREQMMLDA